MIGLINLEVKCAGARSAGNPHAACDVEGAGNGTTERPIRARREKSRIQTRSVLVSHRASSRPYHALAADAGMPESTSGPILARRRRGMEVELLAANEPALAQTTNGLGPAKAFFNPLADNLTGQIPRVARVRPSIADERLVSFWATCGVTSIPRIFSTKSFVS